MKWSSRPGLESPRENRVLRCSVRWVTRQLPGRYRVDGATCLERLQPNCFKPRPRLRRSSRSRWLWRSPITGIIVRVEVSVIRKKYFSTPLRDIDRSKRCRDIAVEIASRLVRLDELVVYWDARKAASRSKRVYVRSERESKVRRRRRLLHFVDKTNWGLGAS